MTRTLAKWTRLGRARARPFGLPNRAAAAMGCLALSLALVAAGPASAEGLGDGVGVLNAKMYHPLDGAVPIRVVALDDTNLNLDLRERMVRQLQDAKFVLSEQAPLELTFDNEVVQGTFESAKPSLGRLQAGTSTGVGRRSTDTGVDVNVNVWSSTQDSVLGGRKSAGSKRLASQFRIFAVLQDRRSGTRIWEGDVRAAMTRSDLERLGRSMVVPLVDSLGQTVRREAVELR